MTRQENTGIRPLDFSAWVRTNLPDSSTGYLVSDLDFIFYNYKTKKIALCEIKTRNKGINTWQGKLFEFLDSCIKKGLPPDWTYLGFFLIRFEHTFFSDGLVFLNGQPSSEEEIKLKLSF